MNLICNIFILAMSFQLPKQTAIIKSVKLHNTQNYIEKKFKKRSKSQYSIHYKTKTLTASSFFLPLHKATGVKNFLFGKPAAVTRRRHPHNFLNRKICGRSRSPQPDGGGVVHDGRLLRGAESPEPDPLPLDRISDLRRPVPHFRWRTPRYLSLPASQNTLERRRDMSQRRIYARKISHVYTLSLKSVSYTHLTLPTIYSV